MICDLPESLFMVAETLLIFDHHLRRLRVLANALVENEDADAAYDARGRRRSEKVDAPARQAGAPAGAQCPRPAAAGASGIEHDRGGISADGRAGARVHPRGRYFPGGAFAALRDRVHGRSAHALPLPAVRESVAVSVLPEVRRASSRWSASRRRCTCARSTARSRSGPSPARGARGNTPEQDEANASELLADPKERAEHLMLVDLARNDVGRIAEFGSVRVTDFMTIERYSHVMHIVSNVVGQLHPDKNAYDVMRATFPAGTVSGSPEGARDADHQPSWRRPSGAPTPARSVTSDSTATRTPASRCGPSR